MHIYIYIIYIQILSNIKYLIVNVLNCIFIAIYISKIS